MKKNHKPLIMGILNTTPDSFFEGSRFQDQAAIERGLQLFHHGADILDVGGESSRPGADPVDLDTELQRVIPVISALKKQLNIPISIDTIKPKVAEAAIKAGATLINDVSGFANPEMIGVAVDTQVEICLMHTQGNPKTMQINPQYSEGIIPHLLQWFERKIDSLIAAGIPPEKIILDPGIGFGKTVDHNVEILHNICQLKTLGFPVLFGASRKSFLSKILDKPASELLAATIAANTIALLSGTDIIRVHDVLEHRDVINFLDYYNKN